MMKGARRAREYQHGDWYCSIRVYSCYLSPVRLEVNDVPPKMLDVNDAMHCGLIFADMEISVISTQGFLTRLWHPYFRN